MLLLPPRHGKSELASRRFPAFHLGHFPGQQFISAASTAELAGDFGREVKEIINSLEYQNLFPETRLAEDSQAKGKWHTAQGGIYYSIGVGGSVLGRGADIALIDDPYATFEDAQSDTIRKKVWEWYNGTIYNRLMPGGRIVVINHRMHEDDLCGRLIQTMKEGGDTWEIVELPAIANEGTDDEEALWPEWYPLERLNKIRSSMQLAGTSIVWSGMYQQKPTIEDGDFFKREHFRYYTVEPAHLTYYGASDYAVTEGDTGDWTVHVVVGVDAADNLYVVDLWRQRAAPDVSIEAMIDMHDESRTLGWGLEKDIIQKSIAPALNRRMTERRVYVPLDYLPIGRQDKAMRAQSIRARVNLGKVYFPKTAPWLADFERELLAFPNGKHDDHVDAFGLIGRMIDMLAPAPDVDDRPPIDHLADYSSLSGQYDPDADALLG